MTLHYVVETWWCSACGTEGSVRLVIDDHALRAVDAVPRTLEAFDDAHAMSKDIAVV